MSSEDRRFSGKVYRRRSRKDVSPAAATVVTAPETEQPEKANDVPKDQTLEREKRSRKPNRFYDNSEYFLADDKLPFEIYKRSKNNKIKTKIQGFATGLKQGEMRTDSTHVEGDKETDNGTHSSLVPPPIIFPICRRFSPISFISSAVMDSDKRRFSGKVYSRRNRRSLKKDVSPATSARVTEPEIKVTFPVDSEERRFSGKVYSRKNSKTLKKGVSLATTAGVIICLIVIYII
ncbi:hypothetical protein EJD97_015075 [Solanum chilense]|uniref:Uncharacterized protein n=1 Tax=Solanum chilense TaxID=4083 RepID=A0A6N2BA41_SOLCI|nr:hypothetical protein EJD97_015075 [Solanum chilense]